MTTLLSKALKQIEQLSQELQDEIAEQLIEDIRGEHEWQKTLAKPQGKLSQLVEKALQDSAEGRTRQAGFDEL